MWFVAFGTGWVIELLIECRFLTQFYSVSQVILVISSSTLTSSTVTEDSVLLSSATGTPLSSATGAPLSPVTGAPLLL